MYAMSHFRVRLVVWSLPGPRQDVCSLRERLPDQLPQQGLTSGAVRGKRPSMAAPLIARFWGLWVCPGQERKGWYRQITVAILALAVADRVFIEPDLLLG